MHEESVVLVVADAAGRHVPPGLVEPGKAYGASAARIHAALIAAARHFFGHFECAEMRR